MAHEIRFENPEIVHFRRNIYGAAARGLPMVEKDRHVGEPGCVIASTGPSIEDRAVQREIDRLVRRRGWTLIALKEAIGYFADRGFPVRYSVSMDPGGPRQIKRTPIRPGVTYCLASSCHPDLYDHVLRNGGRVEVFHSACGYGEPKIEASALVALDVEGKVFSIFEGAQEVRTNEGFAACPVTPVMLGEVDVYRKLFPVADVMCGGFAVVNRALALAKYMGFPQQVLAGADFGWRDPNAKSHYASFVEVGAVSDGFMTDGGKIDGRTWYTRPDQLASAAAVAHGVLNKEVTVIGDSLARALAARGKSFVDNVVKIN